METPPLEWEALEHHHEHKSADWYWTVGIIAGSATIASFLLDNVMFGLVIIVAAITLMLQAARPPRIIKVIISEHGVRVGRFQYRYDSLESFWINKHETPPALLLNSKRMFAPLMVIRLEDMEIDAVRALLSAHIPQVEQQEPLLQKLAEYLGF